MDEFTARHIARAKALLVTAICQPDMYDENEIEEAITHKII